MFHNPFLYLSYGFGVKALISAVLTGLTCSAVGSYVILRKMSFAGAGLAHIALAGVAFGIFLGVNPTLTALVFSLLSSIIIWFFQLKRGLHFDATMGALFATSVALAVIFLSLSGAYGSSALSYLFGSPLSVTDVDLLLLTVTTLIVFSFFFIFWREIYLISFSQEIAKASGYKVELITFLMSLLIALVVTFSLKAVGALLVFSLLVMPAASAFRLAGSYSKFFTLTVLFGFLSSLLGILVSFSLDAPSGATITLVSFLIFLLSSFLD
ncbi:zinc transport system permease protein [Thermovibrio guaymasensis]|uniref:Zinc transport system permease protein n=1 Tax=Thermovibrio guaymasensis TaxID=240167 RepID=A0A420W8K7_9BACT|nr:metal ABC transporter permease [Thermovibrio guaymasensis]RKQ63637.1 zinc transport system permease protein [Thermovibrio guaymasensis]